MPSINVTTGETTASEGVTQVDSNGATTDQGGVTRVSLTTDQPGHTGDRPAWLPEQYENVAAFRADYDKYMAEHNGGPGADTLQGTEGADTLEGSEAADETPAEVDLTTPPEGFETLDAFRATLAEAGGIYADPRYEPFAIEFEKTGDLRPESIAAAAAAFGVPENAVSDFIAGHKAQREVTTLQATQAEQAQRTTLLNAVGLAPDVYTGDGTGAFDKWAAENIPQADLDVYNNATDLAAAQLMLRGWADKFKSATRVPRDVTEARRGPGDIRQAAPEVKPFASMQEQLKAQGSTKYATDSAYRNEVSRRIAISQYS